MVEKNEEISRRLEYHVTNLSKQRFHLFFEKNVKETIDYISKEMKLHGYTVKEHEFIISGRKAINLECLPELNAENDIIIACTAHHDTYFGTPGADDNASSIAVLLEVARLLSENSTQEGISFLFFDLEEITMQVLFFFALQLIYEHQIEKTEDEDEKKELEIKKKKHLEDNEKHFGKLALQGSKAWVNERLLRFPNLKAIINLESVGFKNTRKNSQKPIPDASLIPTTGDFLALVYTPDFQWLFSKMFSLFPKELKVVPIKVPPDHLAFGSRSDHLRFWEIGFPAVMLTDTFEYRNPNYHQATDRPSTLDYQFMNAQVRWLLNILPNLTKTLKDTTVWPK